MISRCLINSSLRTLRPCFATFGHVGAPGGRSGSSIRSFSYLKQRSSRSGFAGAFAQHVLLVRLYGILKIFKALVIHLEKILLLLVLGVEISTIDLQPQAGHADHARIKRKLRLRCKKSLSNKLRRMASMVYSVGLHRKSSWMQFSVPGSTGPKRKLDGSTSTRKPSPCPRMCSCFPELN